MSTSRREFDAGPVSRPGHIEGIAAVLVSDQLPPSPERLRVGLAQERRLARATLVSLSFKVPLSFRLRFKLRALQRGVSMAELLELAFKRLDVDFAKDASPED
jgi:hypothetical protein